MQDALTLGESFFGPCHGLLACLQHAPTFSGSYNLMFTYGHASTVWVLQGSIVKIQETTEQVALPKASLLHCPCVGKVSESLGSR
jgi:hypothetical protein